MPRNPKRRVCFVTGTRAEFGLMESTLAAIRTHPKLELQIVVTGMHLSRRYGRTVDAIARKIHATVPWSTGTGNPLQTARSTGRAITALAETFAKLKSDIILVVGDRVEAFAAASAAHISGTIVAHVHGGDRALGQVDDSLRHAITKLSHIHFAATKQSADRIAKLGEDSWRIHQVGAPGIDQIRDLGSTGFQPVLHGLKTRATRPAIIVLHPTDADDFVESNRARLILNAVKSFPFDRIVIIHPNNDPGSRGIARRWNEIPKTDKRFQIHRNLDRHSFLGLLRRAAVLVGNSSSGIIEAGSFGTPVIDIGPRQLGRERSQNVTNVPYRKALLIKAIKTIWNGGKPIRFPCRNVYGGKNTGRRIASVLSSTPLSDRLARKLIAY